MNKQVFLLNVVSCLALLCIHVWPEAAVKWKTREMIYSKKHRISWKTQSHIWRSMLSREVWAESSPEWLNHPWAASRWACSLCWVYLSVFGCCSHGCIFPVRSVKAACLSCCPHHRVFTPCGCVYTHMHSLLCVCVYARVCKSPAALSPRPVLLLSWNPLDSPSPRG